MIEQEVPMTKRWVTKMVVVPVFLLLATAGLTGTAPVVLSQVVPSCQGDLAHTYQPDARADIVDIFRDNCTVPPGQ